MPTVAYESIARLVMGMIAKSVHVAGELKVSVDFIETSAGVVEMEVRCEEQDPSPFL
jgi:hypothetical protein